MMDIRRTEPINGPRPSLLALTVLADIFVFDDFRFIWTVTEVLHLGDANVGIQTNLIVRNNMIRNRQRYWYEYHGQ